MRSAFALRNGAPSFERAQRAGPALPSYLVLHRAGFAFAAAIADGAVGSYPTVSPLPARVPFVDIPKVFLRAITGFRSTGGIFSVALSVTRFSRTASPGVTRRVALPRFSRGGVRTFLPPHVALGFNPAFRASQRSSGLSSRPAACAAEPAIIQLTRTSIIPRVAATP